jgi:hypothetical protein
MKPVLAGQAATLVALQRLAGNQAVTALLDRPIPVQRLVRFGDDAGKRMIKSITLDRLPGTGGGAHTTAFQLFLETVQNNVINATYEQAIKRLKAMVKDAQEFPGYGPNLQAKVDDFENSYKEAKKSIGSPDNHAYYVETLSESYVRLRNSLDYTKHRYIPWSHETG